MTVLAALPEFKGAPSSGILAWDRCFAAAGAGLSSTAALHRGPVTAVAALPEAQGALAVTGGQDAAVLLCSVPALSAGLDISAPAAAQPLVAYRYSILYEMPLSSCQAAVVTVIPQPVRTPY